MNHHTIAVSPYRSQRMALSEMEQRASTVGEAFLEGLLARGIEYLFVNSGTDFATLVEAYARQAQSGLELPKYVVCAHENLATGMAHGFYLGARRPQAVMLHVSVGTANSVCAVMNAARQNVPMLVIAGRSPILESRDPAARSMPIHWAQEMFDQAGMLRELVKWDYELRDARQVEDVLDRALSVAATAPCGPVYLSLPREVLTQPPMPQAGRRTAYQVPADPAPAPEGLERLAGWLSEARFPVFIINDFGACPQDVALLAQVAEAHGIGVVEPAKASAMNLSPTNSMHLGGDVAGVLREADLVLVLNTDAPWVPLYHEPSAACKVVQVGVDPLYTHIPMRTFPADLALTASPRSFLAALRVQPVRGSEERRSRLAASHASFRVRRAERIKAALAGGKITKELLNATLDAAKPKDAMVVNEYWVDRNIVDFEVPGTYFSHSPAGGLGFGLPVALGLQLSEPDRLVIACLGDGAYVFANPSACHMAAASVGLPVLTILANNGQWEAVRRSTLQVHPAGAAAKQAVVPMSSLQPSPAFERYIEASGGVGLRVERADQLMPQLERAIALATQDRRQVLLNVLCE